jgi:hypothetical protein
MDEKLDIVRKRSSLLVAGSVLMLIASCFALAEGLFGFFIVRMSSVPVWSHHSDYQIVVTTFLGVSIFEIVAFTFGLNSSVQILRRKKFTLIIGSTGVLVFSGFLSFLFLLLPVYAGGQLLTYLFGIPYIALSILGSILVAFRKQEFT